MSRPTSVERVRDDEIAKRGIILGSTIIRKNKPLQGEIAWCAKVLSVDGNKLYVEVLRELGSNFERWDLELDLMPEEMNDFREQLQSLIRLMKEKYSKRQRPAT